jgi:hypothetical protein
VGDFTPTFWHTWNLELKRYLSSSLGKELSAGSRQRRILSLALREARNFVADNAYDGMDL